MTNTIETFDRRWVIFGAVLIQLCLGAIYAWSVFTAPLKESGWSVAQTQYVFTAGLVSFALVMIVAGRIMPRFGPRRLVVAGGVVLGAGYLFAGLLGGTQFWPVFLGVGVIGGIGIGLAYVVPIAVGMRWFPDKKGFITGLAVAGFGFGVATDATLLKKLILPFTFLMVYPMMVTLKVRQFLEGGDIRQGRELRVRAINVD